MRRPARARAPSRRRGALYNVPPFSLQDSVVPLMCVHVLARTPDPFYLLPPNPVAASKPCATAAALRADDCLPEPPVCCCIQPRLHSPLPSKTSNPHFIASQPALPILPVPLGLCASGRATCVPSCPVPMDARPQVGSAPNHSRCLGDGTPPVIDILDGCRVQATSTVQGFGGARCGGGGGKNELEGVDRSGGTGRGDGAELREWQREPGDLISTACCWRPFRQDVSSGTGAQ